MLIDFFVQPYFKRIFVLSEVHKQSDISTILASSVWDEIKRAARAVRYDSDFIWQTESWPMREYILSEKDKNAIKLSDAPLHQGVIFQCQVAMGKATRNQHLLLILKGEDFAVSIPKGITRSEININRLPCGSD